MGLRPGKDRAAGIWKEELAVSNLTDRIYEVLKAKIISQEIKMGAKLREDELASNFSTSRTPVREALNRLVAEGLVVLSPRRGFSVVTLTVDDFRNLLEVRGAVENLAVEKVIERLTPEMRSDLVSLMRAYENALQQRNLSECLFYDSSFHSYIAEMSGNRWITEILDRMDDYCQIVRHVGCRTVEDIELSYREHKDIADAILECKVKAASEAMRRHVRRVRDTVIRYLHENYENK